MFSDMRSEPNQRVIAASAPGKVILSGEHSVVYNRRAIATTLSLRLTVRLERCHTNTIALISQVMTHISMTHRKTSGSYRWLEGSVPSFLSPSLICPSEKATNGRARLE